MGARLVRGAPRTSKMYSHDQTLRRTRVFMIYDENLGTEMTLVEVKYT